MTRRHAATFAIVALVLAAVPAGVSAYLTLGSTVNGTSVTARWSNMPIRYFVKNRAAANVTPTQLQTALTQSFDAWAAVPTASVSATFTGFTNAEPVREDGATVVGFQVHDELERTLGATSFTVDRTTGALVEADIFLNSFFDWSVATAGETNRFDVQSILTHEVGHLLGLGHSLLGETEIRAQGGRRVIGKRSVMFPIAYAVGTVLDRTLQDDDKAGISESYPTAPFLKQSGSIAGRVTLDGVGIFGAHVVAFNTKTQQTVGGFSLNASGDFVISGLTPGIYVLRVEPLDDADLTSFFSAETKVDVGFKAAFHSKLVTAPAGGAGERVEIKVTRK
ncbi:MAG: carboxypeptidase regulatory-like domain-containing protein [Acidobacteria bacterium]|nr:carboxypeptidase regulatory-like domain-containing protein [Acidobacteriota bacterium]